MSDLREALDRILIICNGARTYQRRVQQIHEVAMHGLGMTESQRLARHTAVYDRIGDEHAKGSFLAREAKRKAKAEARAPEGAPP